MLRYYFKLYFSGIGYGQVLSTFFITGYYAALMCLTLRYFILSFYEILPWSYCREEYGELCIDSKLEGGDVLETPLLREMNTSAIKKSSAEHFF